MDRRPSTQDISWFLDLHSNKQLDLSPPYQRRSVWTKKDREFFLDTIFRDYPCPAIFLHKELSDDGKTIYHVVDGKQRIETIIAFTENKIAIPKNFGDAGLDGKKWRDLVSSTDIQSKFWDYVLTVEFVKSIEGTVLNNVFDRLNRNSRKLEREELRHAKYEGWFISLAESESEKEEWKKLKVVTTARAKRMKDVQFISELLLCLFEKKIIGFDQDYLDEKFAEYDDPEQTHASFSQEDAVNWLEEIKDYLLSMENHNNCITDYAKTFGNFYTIWAAVSLQHHRLPDANLTAERFKSFIEKVNEISKQEEIEEFYESRKNKAEYKDPLNYYRNALGASTDLSQREARLNSLLKALVLEQ